MGARVGALRLSRKVGGCSCVSIEYVAGDPMEAEKPKQRAWARFAAALTGTALSVQLGVACSSDRRGDDVTPGMGGSGAAAPMAGMGAGIGAAGMMQVSAGSGGAGASAGAAGSGGAGGIAGATTGGSGGVGGAAGMASGGSGGAMDGGGGEGGASGASGSEADAGMTGPDASMASDTCAALPSDATPPYSPVYRVPLRVHTTRSDLERDDLCGSLEEVNEIWWTQAGVCFEIEIVDHDEIAETGMDLWFERSSPFPNGTQANGVYAGPHEIYSLDEPNLNPAPNPVRYLNARTAAHELGHGLGLDHQNCGTACNDLLMTSGRRGFALVTGSPANRDEHARARDRAPSLALNDTTPTVCSAPVFVDDEP
jgi:hypothetical protein